MAQNTLARFANKKLNEVVFSGSHDAGVTSGTGWTKTQTLHIGKQAEAGVRFFDLRMHRAKGGAIKTFHAPDIAVHSGIRNKKIKSISPGMGGWGDGITKILLEARYFVTSNTDEFLILKFDKCSCYDGIAAACMNILQDEPGNPARTGVHYMPNVNLNVQTVGSLAGKVITVLPADKIPLTYSNHMGNTGINSWTNLFDKDTGTSSGYKPGGSGLQYFGKFSGSPKISKSMEKQAERFREGAGTSKDAVGMMYWTATTPTIGNWFANIKKRDKKLWKGVNSHALQRTWYAGLQESINDRLSQHGKTGADFGSFMPNIVMIDFADPGRCTTINELNDIATHQLKQLNASQQ
jgi:hypothetical protein